MAFSTAIDEKKLIEDLQRESTAHKAFELLMRTFSEPLYWQIRKMVYNHDDANDLLQNVFIKAWNNIHNFRGEARLSTWLYKIAVNESINFLNREKSHHNISADSEDSSFLLDNLAADDYFDGDELKKQLLAEIAKLPEKQRLVFNMKYFDEMKYEEISDILGTSVGALKASYHHAVKKLSKAFGIASLLLCLFLSSLTAFAVPATREILMYTQPDGSVIEFRYVGDENNHKMLSVADGVELAFDSDDFLKPISEIPALCNVRDEYLKDKYLISNSTFPTEGTPHALVIIVSFPDKFFSIEQPQDYYYRMLNEVGFNDYGATGSARDFFVANSSGVFTPQFDVHGPVVMSHPMKYYGENDRYGYDKHPEEVVIEALTKLDSTVDFSIYDTDGDGEIDNVYIFYAGYGEADTYQKNTIWPHSADILDFNLDKDYYFDGKLLNRYAMSNEVNGTTRKPDGIGTFVHEFSHVLGLPDLYSTDYNSAFTPGGFSTLDYAPYNNLGRTPANYSIFERMSLNWAKPVEILESGEYSLSPIADSNEGYLISTPFQDEFYILENRQLQGNDKFIPGHGMLVWHIDFNQKIWDDNVVNNTPRHQYVDIIEADNLQTEVTRDGDPFPGTNNVISFGYSTSPSLRGWNGAALDVLSISDIKETADGKISFYAKVNTTDINHVSSAIADSYKVPVVSIGKMLKNISNEEVGIYNTSGSHLAVLNPGNSCQLPAGVYIIFSEDSSFKLLHK